MTKKANFEAKEWHDLLHLACIGVSYKYSTRDLHSLNQLVVFIREMMSVQQFLTSAREKYGRYELINDLINELVTSCNSREEMLNDNLADFKNLKPVIERANQILNARVSAEEAQAMRAFTYELAFEIANAAGDGFFGTGEKISQSENEFLQELKRRLLDI